MAVIIVLSDCPPKLRGDMTKWFFEINTGVYVGNIGARVRENLWQRITENIGHGRATMVYSAPGEQHLDFRVHNAYWEPVDFDGIKLMRRPERRSTATEGGHEVTKPGFSKASKHRAAATHAKKTNKFAAFHAASYVVLDLETTGLDEKKDEIIEIAAVLVDRGKVVERMQMLVRCNNALPTEIKQLTGISNEELATSGKTLEDAILALMEFAEDLPFVCHNAPFEQGFLQAACMQIGEVLENRFIDTLKLSQLLLPNLQSHKLSTLAEHFGLTFSVQHRAQTDCEATYGVYTKLMELAFSEPRNSEQ